MGTHQFKPPRNDRMGSLPDAKKIDIVKLAARYHQTRPYMHNNSCGFGVRFRGSTRPYQEGASLRALHHELGAEFFSFSNEAATPIHPKHQTLMLRRDNYVAALQILVLRRNVRLPGLKRDVSDDVMMR